MKKKLGWLGFSLVVIFGFLVTAFYAFPVSGQIPVLVYHFIGENAPDNKLIISERDFERQIVFLKRFGYQVISLDDLYRIKTGERHANLRMVAITFDDGDQSFYHRAYPILKKYNFPVAVFVVLDNVRQRKMGSMSFGQLRELQGQGVIIGSHTVSHPVLTEVPLERQRFEMERSKLLLRKQLHEHIHYLSYPTGDFDERVKRVAREVGYRMAFGTFRKKLRGEKEDLFSIQRLSIKKSHANLAYFWLTLSGIYQAYHRARANS